MADMQSLSQKGQSIWFDYIQRSLITSGELQGLIDQGLCGITSNPSIFEKAILVGHDYDEELAVLRGREPLEIYEALALRDIGLAADLMLPVYEQSGALDGYVSMEVNPHLAHDTAGTIDEARRLFKVLNRPNIMIKVPATAAGLPAIETLISEGININVTLLFSVEQYAGVAEAFISGLEKRKAAGQSIERVASVASFFVSRVDAALDRVLPDGHELQAKIAIDNCKLAYARFEEIFSGARWQELEADGAQLQRLLWASTGTKSAAYADTLYIDSLVGPHTVNTVPPATLKAWLDHGSEDFALGGVAESAARVGKLPALGVDLQAITEQLLAEGLAAFEAAFDKLVASIGGR